MEKSYQERILEKYQSFEAVKDCFAIERLQEAMHREGYLLGFAPRDVTQDQVDKITAKSDLNRKRLKEELDAILSKYPDAFQKEGND